MTIAIGEAGTEADIIHLSTMRCCISVLTISISSLKIVEINSRRHWIQEQLQSDAESIRPSSPELLELTKSVRRLPSCFRDAWTFSLGIGGRCIGVRCWIQSAYYFCHIGAHTVFLTEVPSRTTSDHKVHPPSIGVYRTAYATWSLLLRRFAESTLKRTNFCWPLWSDHSYLKMPSEHLVYIVQNHLSNATTSQLHTNFQHSWRRNPWILNYIYRLWQYPSTT